MCGNTDKDAKWPYPFERTFASELGKREPGTPLRCTDECFTFKHMYLTTEVITYQLIEAVDAFLAKCGVKTLEDVEWWQPQTSQTV